MQNLFEKFLGLFKKTPKREPGLYYGPEPMMDEWSRNERSEFIHWLVTDHGKTESEAEVIADTWVIMTIQVQIGHVDHGKKYCPVPTWDPEWGFRSYFDTREEAEEHVRKLYVND